MRVMNLKQFIKSFPSTAAGKQQLEKFAAEAGTSVGYLRLIAGGHRRASADMAIAIESASGREVTREELRPDYWPPKKRRRAS